MNGSFRLFEYPGDMVRLPCEKCGRAGQYRKQRLSERFQPRGFTTQALKQVSRSNSQFWPIITGGTTGETCWVPAVGGGAGGGVRSLVHVSNRTWHFVEHEVCAILFFGMGVKLPAKLAGADAKRIIATRPSFISHTMSCYGPAPTTSAKVHTQVVCSSGLTHSASPNGPAPFFSIKTFVPALRITGQ